MAAQDNSPKKSTSKTILIIIGLLVVGCICIFVVAAGGYLFFGDQRSNSGLVTRQRSDWVKDVLHGFRWQCLGRIPVLQYRWRTFIEFYSFRGWQSLF